MTYLQNFCIVEKIENWEKRKFLWNSHLYREVRDVLILNDQWDKAIQKKALNSLYNLSEKSTPSQSVKQLC